MFLSFESSDRLRVRDFVREHVSQGWLVFSAFYANETTAQPYYAVLMFPWWLYVR